MTFVDCLTSAALSTVVEYELPYCTNIPCNPQLMFEKPRLMPAMDYPALGSGLPLNMSLSQKLRNFWYVNSVRMTLIKDLVIPMTKLKTKLEFTTPGWNVYGTHLNAKRVIVNTIIGVEYPYKPHAHTLSVGPCLSPSEMKEIAEVKANNMQTDITNWLNEHPQIVYIGLGTMTLLDELQVGKYLAMIREFPEITFLFKISKSSFQPDPKDVPENVRIMGFLPSQFEVLAHDNVKVFVSHCGGNGFHEGILFGKAILGASQWTDCHDFAQRVVDCGVGLKLHKTLPCIDVKEACGKLRKLIDDDGYRQKAAHWSQEMSKAGGAKKAAAAILQAIREQSK